MREIVNKFRKLLTEIEYGITAKPNTSVNPISNTLLESIHQVLGNLVRTFYISTQPYVDEDDPWTGILAEVAFSILSTTNSKKGYIPVQLIFGRDIILPIKHRMDCKLICHRKQMQINIDKTRENKHIFDYGYKVRYKLMSANHTVYKYETPYKFSFVITQCFPTGMINLQCGAIKIRYNIFRIKPYKSYTKVEYFYSTNMYDAVKILFTIHIRMS